MKNNIIKIIISFTLLIIGLILKLKYNLISNIIFITSYLLIGYEVIIKSFKNILEGKIFDENFLMLIATIGAFLIGENAEATSVMLFYQVGEMLQDYAVDKSKKSITKLMDLKVEVANKKIGEKIVKTKVEEIKIGDIIIIKPYEKIPLDGIIIKGTSTIDTKNLTGESIPRSVSEKDEVLSGSINRENILEVKVTKEYNNSTVSKILDLVSNASDKKSKSENFISRFAKVYTPIVVFVAIILSILPPIILNQDFNTWIYRALTFLVVSCPCALVISIPLSFFAGIGLSSKLGILIKGSNHLENLSKTEIMVFDKTGTLTKGVFKVQKVCPIEIDEDEFLKLVSTAESYSNHPISKSIIGYYNKKIDHKLVKNIEEKSGMGVIAKINKKEVAVGNDKLLNELGIKFDKVNDMGTIIYVSIDKHYSGYIVISDEIKDDSYNLIKELKKDNIVTAMLTGDKEEISKSVCEKLGIDLYYSELLPYEKVEKINDLMNETATNEKLTFIGDGINDAPSLALADIGVSMGGVGSDAAIEASDIVIMNDEPSKIIKAIKISKKTIRIVKENIIFALFVKLSVLVLSSLGISSMWHAVFADVGVSLIAIINSLRVLRTRGIK